MFRIVLVGGFGGIAPSLVDKAQAFANGDIETWLSTAEKPLISILCALLAIGVYFAIGAVIATIYEKQELQKALLLGIGAPAMIMAAANGNPGKPQDVQITTAARFGFIGSAHAQALPSADGVDLRVNPGLIGEKCPTCDITFLGKGGNVIATQPLAAGAQQTGIQVPMEADKIISSGGNANPAAIDIQALGATLSKSPAKQGPVTLEVDINRNYWSDLSRSFGAKSVQPNDFNVKIAE